MRISRKKALENQRNQLLLELSAVEAEICTAENIQDQFEAELPVHLHRRNGWLNSDESERVARYFEHGISAEQIRRKFACSVVTVYSHVKKHNLATT